jgi:biotin carboxyl carrier protein
MEKAKEDTKGIAKNMGDVLIYALYPTTGLRFLKWKYGLEAPPADVKPKTLADIKREDELVVKARAGKLVEKVEVKAPPKGPGLRTFNVFVGDQYYQVEVEPAGGVVINASTPAASSAPAPAAAAASSAPAPKAEAPVPAKVAEGEAAIIASMPGIVIRYEKKAGDAVKAGDVVVVFEAMKMQSTLTSPIDGAVKTLGFAPGAKVAKGDILAIIEK